MSDEENYFFRNLDPSSAKELSPKDAGLYKDTNGVYLSGSQTFYGDDWKANEDGTSSISNVFSFSKCKSLFSQEDVQYSHKAAVNQEEADKNLEELWGFSCYLATLQDVDPNTFKYVKPTRKRLKYATDGYYFRDKNGIYYKSQLGEFMFKVQSKSPKSFVAHCAFAQDEHNVFFMGRKIAKADGSSFHALDSGAKSSYCYADHKFKYENDNWVKAKITKL